MCNSICRDLRAPSVISCALNRVQCSWSLLIASYGHRCKTDPGGGPQSTLACHLKFETELMTLAEQLLRQQFLSSPPISLLRPACCPAAIPPPNPCASNPCDALAYAVRGSCVAVSSSIQYSCSCQQSYQWNSAACVGEGSITYGQVMQSAQLVEPGCW
jgi:hypothetical protein